MRIIVDAFGGDNAPLEILKGSAMAVQEYGVELLVTGPEAEIRRVAGENGISLDGMTIVDTPDVITMEDEPRSILKEHKGCSMAEGLRRLSAGEGDAFVSAGSTGALIMGSTFIVKRIKGVPRAALAPLMPGDKGPFMLIDSGANVDCRPYHLFQFGLMGDAFARDLLGYAAPRVSLLSIGEEEGKGNSQVKEAYELLKLAQNLNFVGNAEGRDIFTGDIDVVVCDGFVGNVVVKMSEGLASALVRMLKRLFTSGFLPALGGMLAKGAFKKFATTIDYAEYGGAPLLGLQGLAIVCHGRSSARAMQNAIKMAGTFVRKGTNDRLAETILANEELTRFSRAI